MPLNATKREQTLQAAKELALKMRLEKPMVTELEKLFDKIANDLARTLDTTGGVIRAEAYERKFAEILDKQYKRVQPAFEGEITDYLTESAKEQDPEKQEESILALIVIASVLGVTLTKLITAMRASIKEDLKAFRINQTRLISPELTKTTGKHIREAVISAEKSVASEAEDATEQLPRKEKNKRIAKLAKVNFKRKSNPRPKLIAVTETQKTAESTKDIERKNYVLIRNSSTAVLAEIEKGAIDEYWVTMGDDVVRPWHLEADFQKKENGFFIVKGQRLTYPGDNAHGASLDNILGCRCSAVTSIDTR